MTTDYSNPFPNRVQKSKRHGMTRTKVYRAWINIKVRCLDPDCKFFEHYGGRGITMHPGWQDSFEGFYKEVGDPPTPKHSIDRIDNEKGYEPGNCRWATMKEQSNNTRRNRPVTINGETKNLMEWAEVFGIAKQALMYRLRTGVPVETALTTPIRGHRKNGHLVTIGRSTKSITAWIEEIGINRQTVFYRMREGWSAEKALTTPVKPRNFTHPKWSKK